MADKQLKDKAVSIKGKSYVLVSDRVLYFNEHYPNGSIVSSYELIDNTYHVTAKVTPDCDKPDRHFVDHSQATIGDGMVNKSAALENASTSAVGRALAMMGIGVIESIASVDEINKATGSAGKAATPRPTDPTKRLSPKQIELLLKKAKFGLKSFDKDEVVAFIDQTLGKSITDLTMGEMDEALIKLDKALRRDKVNEIAKTIEDPDKEFNQLLEGVDPDQDIDINKIPF